MTLVFYASNPLREKWRKARTFLRKRVGEFTPRPHTLLLCVLSFYIVCSRLGPVVTRVGESAFEAFELRQRLEAEFDKEGLETIRDTYRRFRDLIQVPGPFARRSSLATTMGNFSSSSKSKRKVGKEDNVKVSSGQGVDEDNPPTSETEGAVVKEDGSSVTQPQLDKGEAPQTSKDENVSEKKEEAAQILSDGEKDKEQLETSKHTDSQEDMDEPDWKKITKRRFSDIESQISTGDLALLYREGQETPHYAVFVQNSKCDPHFPLLLIKGRTRPVPMSKFSPHMRYAHPISAVTRIFYGDYKQVAIRHLQIDEEIPCETAMSMIDNVQKIPFLPQELEAIKNASSSEERSSIVCTLMIAHFYHLLGLLKGDPTTVSPRTLEHYLELSDPVSIKLPPVKLGPIANDDPPLLAKLVEGIYPPPNVVTRTYSSVADTLETGDIVLFSGATSSGAIIKFFDRSQFSHIGLVLKAKYTFQLLIWEASTNKAGLVDIESGKVRRGVELLPLRHKIFSGWYNRVAVRKLAGISPEKRAEIYEDLLKFRKEIQGRPYEKDKVELILSSIDIQEGFLSFLRNKHEDLSSLFCSELVAAAYQRMGLLGEEKLSNEYTPDDFSSARNLQLKHGYLEPEVYIELKFDFESDFNRQTSYY